TTLGEALEHLGREYKLTFDANEEAFRAADVKDILTTLIADPYPIPPMKVRLEAVLKKILSRASARAPLVFVIRRDAIEITTAAALQAEFGGARERPLLPLVWETFREEDLTTAFRRLADASGYNVVVDVRVKDKAKTEVSA